MLRATTDITYLRWHGNDPKKMFYGSYPGDELARWAQVIRGFEAEGRRVYGYFNNDMSGQAIASLDSLRGMLGLQLPVSPQPSRAGTSPEGRAGQ